MIDLELSLEMGIGIVALTIAVYGLLAASLSRRSVSPAFAFVVIGAVMGGAGVGVMTDALPDASALGLLSEITLALVLFSAASTVRIRRLEADSTAVLRLLALGLPLAIAGGALLAWGLFPGISVGLALLIGATLAPTDADLGHQVITDGSVPARIRRILNVESGLNDGIAAPVVTVAIILITVGDLRGSNPILDAVSELALAAFVGIVVGTAGRWLIGQAVRRATTTSSGAKLSVLALALGAFFVTDAFGGSGFIGAFVAGLTFGIGSRKEIEDSVVFTEVQSMLLSLLVWLAFGIVVVKDSVFGGFDPVVVLYAVLSLTLVRMVPVALGLLGSGFDRVTVLFVGWFGPRGLASIVFALLALESVEAVGGDTGPLMPVVAWTVVLSIILHGLSARPLAAWYGRYVADLPADSPEFAGEVEPRLKGAMWSMHGHVDGADEDPA